jgi:hypothetical protein
LADEIRVNAKHGEVARICDAQIARGGRRPLNPGGVYDFSLRRGLRTTNSRHAQAFKSADAYRNVEPDYGGVSVAKPPNSFMRNIDLTLAVTLRGWRFDCEWHTAGGSRRQRLGKDRATVIALQRPLTGLIEPVITYLDHPKLPL